MTLKFGDSKHRQINDPTQIESGLGKFRNRAPLLAKLTLGTYMLGATLISAGCSNTQESKPVPKAQCDNPGKMSVADQYEQQGDSLLALGKLYEAKIAFSGAMEQDTSLARKAVIGKKIAGYYVSLGDGNLQRGIDSLDISYTLKAEKQYERAVEYDSGLKSYLDEQVAAATVYIYVNLGRQNLAKAKETGTAAYISAAEKQFGRATEIDSSLTDTCNKEVAAAYITQGMRLVTLALERNEHAYLNSNNAGEMFDNAKGLDPSLTDGCNKALANAYLEFGMRMVKLALEQNESAYLNFNNAGEMFDFAKEFDPSKADTCNKTLANAYVGLGMRLVTLALKENEPAYLNFNNAGDRFDKAKQFDSSVADKCNKAVASAYVELGKNSLANGYFRTAKENFDAALSANPADAVGLRGTIEAACNTQGDSFREAGKLEASKLVAAGKAYDLAMEYSNCGDSGKK